MRPINPLEKKIEIGHEVWSYLIEGGYTYIYSPNNSESCSTIALRFIATQNEITAAAYGWGFGIIEGTRIGEQSKIKEIKRALEL